MSRPLALQVARLHPVLVHRPGSDVFHVAGVGDLTPSGRFLRRHARTACSARTRRLSALERDGSVLDLGGRRMCARCEARLSAVGRWASQPPLNRDQAVAFWKAAEVSLRDFVVAVAVAATVAETHSIGLALAQVFPSPPRRRPGADRPAWQAALFDVHQQLLRRRNQLRSAERTPEEVAAAAMQREMDAARDAAVLAGQKKSDQVARAVDRRNQGVYQPPWERALADSA